jgi:hypothetical protein
MHSGGEFFKKIQQAETQSVGRKSIRQAELQNLFSEYLEAIAARANADYEPH